MNDITTAHDLSETATRKATELTASLNDTVDTATQAAKDNVGLTIIGGVAVGILVGAMLPFGRRRQKPKKAARALAATLAASISELSQTLAAQAQDRAGSAADDMREKLADTGKTIQDSSASLSKQTKKLADEAAEQLNDSGKAIARKIVKLIEKARA